MANFRLALLAERDIEAILEWTHERIGEQGRSRYETLLIRAILDVAEDPFRPGSLARPELASNARIYHLRLSRDRVFPATQRVRRPRHFLLYRALLGGPLEVGRVLQDGMDLNCHLPPDYHAGDAGETGPG